jgi:hypothetical protein
MTVDPQIVTITITINSLPAVPVQEFAFCNYYLCPYDKAAWTDSWSCACNDRCPVCRTEIEPYHSDHLV